MGHPLWSEPDGTFERVQNLGRELISQHTHLGIRYAAHYDGSTCESTSHALKQLDRSTCAPGGLDKTSELPAARCIVIRGMRGERMNGMKAGQTTAK